MTYPTPTKGFDAIEHAVNKVLRANQFQDLVVQQYKNTYEDFWGLNPEGGSRYSVEEMQAVLDAMPQVTAIDMLQDANAFVVYVTQAYPGKLEDKYHATAWEYTTGEAGIVVSGLREAWLPVEPEQEEEGV
jgi:hypothetical protein